jgi:hypothetical protein
MNDSVAPTGWHGLEQWLAVHWAQLMPQLIPQQLPAAAARLPLQLWALATLGVLVSHALRAARLSAEWQPRIGLGWAAALRLGLLHNAAVCLLPFRSGEAGYAWWLQQGWKVPLRQSAPSLLWLRLQDLCVLAGLTLLCLGLSRDGLTGWLLPVALAAFAVLVACAAWRRLPVHPPASWPGLHSAWTVVQRAAHSSRGGLRGWLYTALNWSLRLTVQGGLLALLLALPLPVALRGATGGEWGSLLPLQPPAGIGPQEAGVWFALQSTGGALPATQDVVAAALLVHLFWLAVGLAAAALAALLPGERPWRRARPISPLREHPGQPDRKSTRLNSSHNPASRMPSSA